VKVETHQIQLWYSSPPSSIRESSSWKFLSTRGKMRMILYICAIRAAPQERPKVLRYVLGLIFLYVGVPLLLRCVNDRGCYLVFRTEWAEILLESSFCLGSIVLSLCLNTHQLYAVLLLIPFNCLSGHFRQLTKT
jgi:hypothetical protein